MAFTYTDRKAYYSEKLKSCQTLPAWQPAIERAARRIVAARARYEAVGAQLGVPWAFIGVLHDRESGGNFRGVLHNGEHILGTGRKTRLVPAGRGPFTTWEEAAIDALRLKGYSLDDGRDWDALERICFEAERFNGAGYYYRGVPSAYVWSGTNIYRGGKYVADGVWSSTARDAQLGILPLYQRVLELAPGLAARGQSRKLRGLQRMRLAIKTLLTTLLGGFTLDNLGFLKEWVGAAQGIFDAKTVVALVVGGVSVWLFVNWLDRLHMDDLAAGRWIPSGEQEEAEAEVPVEHEPAPQSEPAPEPVPDSAPNPTFDPMA